MANNKRAVRLSQEQWKSVNWMSQNVITDILADFGFGCLETDSYDEVKQTLVDNIQDGTIPVWILEDC